MASQNSERPAADQQCSISAGAGSNDNSDTSIDVLNEQAQRCRRLAEATYNREVSEMLGSMAEGYERSAAQLSDKQPGGNRSE